MIKGQYYYEASIIDFEKSLNLAKGQILNRNNCMEITHEKCPHDYIFYSTQLNLKLCEIHKWLALFLNSYIGLSTLVQIID